MKSFSRRIFVLALGTSLLTAVNSPSEAARLAPPRTGIYDGLWSMAARILPASVWHRGRKL